MKLLYVTAHKFCRIKGEVMSSGQFPYSLWERFLPHFEEIHVLAREVEGVNEKCFSKLNIAGGPRVHFHLIPASKNLTGHIQDAGKFKSYAEALMQEADLVIIRNCNLGWSVAQACRKANKPWMMEVAGDYFKAYWYHGSLAAKLFAPFAEWQSKKWISRAPYVMYVTKEYLQKKYPAKGETTYASNVNISVALSDLAYRQRNKVDQIGSSGQIRLGFCGTLFNKQKGLDIAIKALARVKEKLPPFCLYVIGPGNLQFWKDMVKRYRLEDHVTFEGLIPAGEPVLRWFDKIDLYLHPSLQDGLSRSIVESMSRGCPVLASSTGGAHELLPEEVTHTPGDYKTLAGQVLEFVTDKKKLRESAALNLQKSREYDYHVLQKTRDAFMAKFKARYQELDARCNQVSKLPVGREKERTFRSLEVGK